MSDVLDNKLDPQLLDRMKRQERLAYERRVLRNLVAKYPRELQPYEKLRDLVHQYVPDEYPAFRDRWIKMANDKPNDPLALFLAAEALYGKDTPESIRLLEKARATAPTFPWPARNLAGIYFGGKYADAAEAKKNIEAFFASCPTSTDGYAQWLLSKDPSLHAKVTADIAAALRARLERETDPKRLQAYGTLWTDEFRSRPPREYDQLRAQIARDLKRLKKLNPQGDAEWQALLISGYKQSGASPAMITAMEDRLLREYPHSNEAYKIVSARWDATHKEPQNQADATAWAKYQKEYEDALKSWIHNYPDNTYLQREAWFDAVQEDYQISEADGIAAVDTFLQSVRDYDGPSFFGFDYPQAAQFLIERHWQPARALELMKQARASIEAGRALDQNDDLTKEDLQNRKRWEIQQDQSINALILRAAMEAGRPKEVRELRASVERPVPQDTHLQSAYWANRARLAVLEHHAQDALAYYQLALRTREQPPKAFHGKLRDELADEAHASWKAQGRTEKAWLAWSKASQETGQRAEGSWEKATKSLPAFELSDLSGKIWRLKDLQGKTLLISVWATWCGPCQAELPHLENFYEKVKNRSDIQVLTFDIDEDPGLVPPYLKERGYTFPVLLYSGSALNETGNGAVPQTWIVDAHGVWQWKKDGYGGGSDADFEKDVLSRLDSTVALQ